MNFIEHILRGMSDAFSMKSFGFDVLYIFASIILPIFYFKQIRKYLKGEAGVGDFCFHTEIIQAGLRFPALFYCISIANGPVFVSVLLDLIGRSAKIATAKVVQVRYNTRIALQKVEPSVEKLTLVTEEE